MINVPTASFHRQTDLAANYSFKQKLSSSSTNWDSIETISAADDVSAAYDQFDLIIKKAYNTELFTKKTNKIYSKNFKHPWMTHGLLKSAGKKAKLHTTLIKNPSLINKENFTIYRNKFKTLKKKAGKWLLCSWIYET